MFATLKQTNSDHNAELIYIGRSAHSEYQRRTSTHLACKACQSKKVKCSGHPAGCSRCRLKKIDCVYTKSGRGFKKAASGGTPSVKSRIIGETSESRSQESPELSSPPSDHSLLAPGSSSSPSSSSSASSSGHHHLANRHVENASEPPVDAVSSGSRPSRDHQLAIADRPLLNSTDRNDTEYYPQPQPSHADTSYSDIADLPDHDAILLEIDSMILEGTMTGFDPAVRTGCQPVNGSPMLDDHGRRSSAVTSLHEPYDVSPIFSDLSEPGAQSSASLRSFTPNSCQCVPNALTELESLQKLNSGYERRTFDHMLVLKKKTILQCNQILDCSACVPVSNSTVIMLLAVICEKLTLSFCNWANRYAGLRSDPQPTARSPEENSPHSQSSDRINKFFLGGYEVDSTEEQCSLLRSLALVQLRNLRVLLRRLRSTSSLAGWSAHGAMLTNIDRRVQDATAKLLERETICVG